MAEENDAQENNTPAAETRTETATPQDAPPSAAPPDNTAPSEQREAEGESGGNSVNAQFTGGTHADKIINANTVYDVFVSESSEDFTFRAFSADYCAPVSEAAEGELCDTVSIDELTAARLFDNLQTKRLLLLTGMPEIGKQTLALHLSYKTRLAAGAQACRETYVVRPLQRRIKLELQKVVENGRDFGKRVIVFPRIGESDNRDLLDLFARLNKFELDKLTKALTDNGSFLIFTADAAHVKAVKNELKRLDILQEVEAPSSLQLERALEKRVKWILATRKVSEDRAAAALALIEQHKRLLAEQLLKMSSLTLFVQHYLLDIVGENPKFDVQTAINIVESPEHWFLEDLANNFEAWCYVFTLGLCQCEAEPEGVPWLEFETIRREITRALARELHMWRQPPEPAFTNLLNEQSLLKKSRAEIVRQAGVGDLVRFVDASYPAKLWRVFTNSNRRALSAILPVLYELTSAPDPRIRACASRMLGRIGELNPPHITLTAVRDWTSAKPLWRKAAVAYLYEGALSSPDNTYRQMCLAKLDHMAHSSRSGELWTAIAVYKQMGQGGADQLALAVSKLGEITERNFSGWVDWEKKIEQRLEQYARKKKQDLQELLLAAVTVQTLKELRHELRQVYDEDNRIMLAISYSLVALSLQLGAFAVIVELNKWVQQGRKDLAALTSWIFWTEEGIADRLAEYRVPLLQEAAGNAGVRGYHPLVVSLAHACQSEPQAVRQVAQFLAATYKHFSEDFPAGMRQLLRKKFLLHLKQWVDGTWRMKEYRLVLQDLYRELLSSPDAELVGTLRDYLTGDADFADKAHLNRFAKTVLDS